MQLQTAAHPQSALIVSTEGPVEVLEVVNKAPKLVARLILLKGCFYVPLQNMVCSLFLLVEGGKVHSQELIGYLCSFSLPSLSSPPPSFPPSH